MHLVWQWQHFWPLQQDLHLQQEGRIDVGKNPHEYFLLLISLIRCIFYKPSIIIIQSNMSMKSLPMIITTIFSLILQAESTILLCKALSYALRSPSDKSNQSNLHPNI